MASCVRTVHEQRRTHTLLRALCCSERASTASVGRPVERRDGATLSADELLYFLLLQCKKHSTARKDERGLHRKRTGICHVLACLVALTTKRFAAPCTRAHACRARSSRTHHACAPRQPCTCSHAATRAHVKKLGCRARVTGHWPTVGRPAAGTSGSHTRCKHARHLRCVRFPCIADMLCMPSTSTVAQHRTAET